MGSGASWGRWEGGAGAQRSTAPAPYKPAVEGARRPPERRVGNMRAMMRLSLLSRCGAVLAGLALGAAGCSSNHSTADFDHVQLVVLLHGWDDVPDPAGAPGRRRAAARGRLQSAGADPVRLPLPVERVPGPDAPRRATKMHVAIPSEAMPLTKMMGRLDPAMVADSDGFSPGQDILTHLPGATITGLPTQDTIPLSVTTGSPTILLNADTGELVPHWAELDEEFGSDEAYGAGLHDPPRRPPRRRDEVHRRHPPRRRHDGRRARPDPGVPGAPRRDRLVRSLGRAAPEPLRGHLRQARRRPASSRTDLQLAWDYSTASRQNNTAWFLSMRDDALAKVGHDGPGYTLFPPAAAGTTPDPTTSPSCNNLTVGTQPRGDPRALALGDWLGQLLAGQPQPAHLAAPLRPDDRADLHDDAEPRRRRSNFGPDGMPAQNGTAQYEFEVNIPVAATMKPGAPLQNGHGLLGDKTEGDRTATSPRSTTRATSSPSPST